MSRFQHTMRRVDGKWLMSAIELSRLCVPSDRAFSVGAILTDAVGEMIASGRSRETGVGVHAEEVAIEKAMRAGRDLRGCTIYSSLEPCNVRLSGRLGCAQRIINCGISRVVFALREPPVFVTGRGCEQLSRAGVAVVMLQEYGDIVIDINRHLTLAGSKR